MPASMPEAIEIVLYEDNIAFGVLETHRLAKRLSLPYGGITLQEKKLRRDLFVILKYCRRDIRGQETEVWMTRRR